MTQICWNHWPTIKFVDQIKWNVETMEKEKPQTLSGIIDSEIFF